MTGEEIQSKLKIFSGADRGLDKKTEEVVGKILVDEKDEMLMQIKRHLAGYTR